MNESGRRAGDFYPTATFAVEEGIVLLAGEGLFPEVGGFVLDPCAGDGAICAVVKGTGRRPVALELRAEEEAHLAAVCGPNFVTIGDGLRLPPPATWGGYPVLSNPPFSEADDFLLHWTPGRPWAAWLLRLAWLSSAERGPVRKALAEAGSPLAFVGVFEDRIPFVAVCEKECGGRHHMREVGTKCGCCGARVRRQVDRYDYAWFVFSQGYTGRPQIETIASRPVEVRRRYWDADLGEIVSP